MRRGFAFDQTIGQTLHNGGADHSGISHPRYRSSGGGRSDTETHGNRQVGCGAQAAHRVRNRLIGGRGRAGNAIDRDVIDEAARIAHHGLQPVGIGRRRDQPDKIEPGGLGRQAKLAILFRRKIDDNEPIDPNGFGPLQKRRNAHRMDRIVIAHQHNRRGLIGLPKSFDQLQGFRQGLPARERPQVRGLNGGAIGHRVGKGHAEFDDIRPRPR